MKWNRIYALFVARNLEFVRDRSSLAWNLLLPILIIFAFAYAFTGDNPEKFKVGLVASAQLERSAPSSGRPATSSSSISTRSTATWSRSSATRSTCCSMPTAVDTGSTAVRRTVTSLKSC